MRTRALLSIGITIKSPKTDGTSAQGRPPLRVPRNRHFLSPIEKQIVAALENTVPSAALSYRQVLRDLEDHDRLTFRGTANDLRGAVWDLLRTLAPDADVMAQPGFKFEKDTSKPTQRQKARHILKARHSSAVDAAVESLDILEEYVSSLARILYSRTSSSAHIGSERSEIRQMKMYVDAFIAEVFEIHRS